MSRTPRIVIDGRYLGAASGIGAYVRALVTRLPKIAPDLQIRLWVRFASDVPAEIRDAVQIHPVAAHPTGLRTLVAPASLDRLSPSDVFHSPHNILGRGLPCKSIVTVHDTMWVDHVAGCQPIAWRRPVSRAYFGMGIGNALRHATRILTVSAASARCIERLAPGTRDRIAVTHNACECCYGPARDVVTTRARVASLLGVTGEFLVVVGQNQPSKGHELALRAFAAAHLEGVSLVFVQRLRTGSGMIELARRLGVADRVRFVGALPQADLIAVLQSATGLLQTSMAEGFGIPVLEAAACGCPVVASDLPVTREVMSDAALFVPAGQIPLWAAAMRRLLADPGLRRVLRVLGRARSQEFSWDRTAARTLQVYREALQ